MEHFSVGHIITGVALALTFGGMTFFSAIVAPLVFTKLPLEIAGAFIRQIFPWYYLTMAAATLVALVALILSAGSTARVDGGADGRLCASHQRFPGTSG